VTLRTRAALDAIAAIAVQVPQVVVGAGTVQRPVHVVQACSAGARFLVSPGMTPELAAAALATERRYLPGVMTPSEVARPRHQLTEAVPGGGGGRARAVAGARADPPGHRILSDRRHRRALRRQLPGAPNVPIVGGSWMAPIEAIAAMGIPAFPTEQVRG
jgi:2-dehydro-3-deoxyphosphogluconate aldolase / (4S)-4-hydroxy-2-oxoglutarate aldolase